MRHSPGESGEGGSETGWEESQVLEHVWRAISSQLQLTNAFTFDPATPLLRIFPPVIPVQNDTCTGLFSFSATLFVIVKDSKRPVSI